jgi:hypothetical protein
VSSLGAVLRSMPRPTRRAPVVLTAVLLAATSVVAGCSGSGTPDPLDILTSTTRPGQPVTSTVAGPPTTSLGPRLCTTLVQGDLDAAGIPVSLGDATDASGVVTLGTDGAEGACQWWVTAAGTNTFQMTISGSTKATSAQFEAMLSDSISEEPVPVTGLGEQAGYVRHPAGLQGTTTPSSDLIVLDKGRLLRIQAQDAGVVDQTKLVALARLLLPKL